MSSELRVSTWLVTGYQTGSVAFMKTMIRDAKRPQTKKEVKAFLGLILVTIENLSQITRRKRYHCPT